MYRGVVTRMNVLSLFDGMSGAQIAFERVGIKVDNYFASEVDKWAIQITQKNYPDTIQLGDVRKVQGKDLPAIDLMIGGSPCQDLSVAKANRRGLKGERSRLFWEYVRLLKETKPRWFLLENVSSMKRADRDIITETLGVGPIKINSALVSGQQRKRLYWTNIQGVTQPDDKGVELKDVLEGGYTERLKSYCIGATYSKLNLTNYFKRKQRQLIFTKPIRIATIGKGGQGERVYSIDGKSIALSANGGGSGAKTGLYEIGKYTRRLTPLECERLQTVPEGYTEGVSDTQRYRMLGNGFTVEVIAGILRVIKPGKKTITLHAIKETEIAVSIRKGIEDAKAGRIHKIDLESLDISEIELKIRETSECPCKGSLPCSCNGTGKIFIAGGPETDCPHCNRIR